MISAAEMIDRVNGIYGRFGGVRALHAKGTLLRGTFTATPEAAALTRAVHMQGDPVDVTVRVSNGGGNPQIPDYAPDVRGFAAKIYLPDGSRTDIVGQTSPHFPTPTTESFIALAEAVKPSPAALWRFPMFVARNPRTLKALPSSIPASRPPSSYFACRYYATHAFKWVDADGGERYVRYTIVPASREPGISPFAARRRGRDYLQEEIQERLADGPARMRLEVQIAGPGDDPDDPTTNWPKSRTMVDAGTFELTAIDESREGEGDVLVFDPVRVVDGIEPSNDPILLYRTRAYSESVRRRSGIERPAGYDASPSTGGEGAAGRAPAPGA